MPKLANDTSKQLEVGPGPLFELCDMEQPEQRPNRSAPRNKQKPLGVLAARGEREREREREWHPGPGQLMACLSR